MLVLDIGRWIHALDTSEGRMGWGGYARWVKSVQEMGQKRSGP